MNNAVFVETMKSVGKHRTKKKLLSARTKRFLTINLFSENLLATEMDKTKLFMNKPVSLILELSKTPMYGFQYG